MNRDEVLLLAAIGAVFVLLGRKVTSMSAKEQIASVLKMFLAKQEGFSATPYWDVSRWSWGYGTAAPGPTGTITRDAAMDAAITHAFRDYDTLFNLVTRPLTINQWAALLSFAYNLGIGNAKNIVPYVNAYDDDTLFYHWSLYINANGKPLPVLRTRRQDEISLWIS